jgi:hypothetical protein
LVAPETNHDDRGKWKSIGVALQVQRFRSFPFTIAKVERYRSLGTLPASSDNNRKVTDSTSFAETVAEKLMFTNVYFGLKETELSVDPVIYI